LADIGEGALKLLPLELQVQINSKVTARTAARARRDWKESDRIREELKAIGVELIDNKDGTTTPMVKP
jgi:cysteinyl-tRNA synthetase